MNAEFQWWLLILGIVIGGALVYLVLADFQGDTDMDEVDADVHEEELEEIEIEADDRPRTDEPWARGDDAARWSAPTDSVPAGAAAPAADRRPGLVGDDAAVQRDGTQRETPVADLP